MKLLLVSQVPNSRLMGVPRIMHCVADVLRRRGHQVDFFFEEDGHRPWFAKIALLEWAFRVAGPVGRLCRERQYDAVVVTTLSGFVLSTFRRVLLPRKTRIISWHHGWEEMMWEQMREEERLGGIRFSPQFKLYYGGLLLAALRQSLKTQDAAMYTSTEECDFVNRRHPFMQGRVFYIPNGVEPEYLFGSRWEGPERLPPKLLFVGYWDPWRKGRKYLVEAFARIRQRHPEVTLSLVGVRVPAERILEEFPASCRSAVQVIETIEEAELIEVYRQHDIFILPSLFEGMPLVVLEAMAAGLAVVTTANNGMKDLIRHEVNGLLVPRRDTSALVAAIERLIQDAPLRRRLGEAAYVTMRDEYTWEQAGEKYEQVLQKVVDGA